MEILKKILDEVYKELIEEFKIPERSDKIRTFDEIEGMVLNFGKEFERRAIEKSIEEQRKKSEQKKTARGAAKS